MSVQSYTRTATSALQGLLADVAQPRFGKRTDHCFESDFRIFKRYVNTSRVHGFGLTTNCTLTKLVKYFAKDVPKEYYEEKTTNEGRLSSSSECPNSEFAEST